MILGATHDTEAQPIESFQFHNVSEGLSHKRVHAIVQDQKGFIWMGTYSGLNRFNGVSFDNYESSHEPNSIPADDITDLMVAEDGVLWIATGNGIATYQTAQNNFEVYRQETHPGLPDNAAQAIIQTQDEVIWIATSRGVCFYREGTFTKLKSVPDVLVRTL